MRRTFEFLVLATIGLTALGIVAVQAPPRVRSLFPVPLAYGVLAGGALAWLTRVAGVVRRPSTVALAAGLIALGLAGITVERWRVQVAELKAQRIQAVTEDDRKKAAESGAQSALARRMLESVPPPADPRKREEYEEMLKSVRTADDEIRSRLTDEGIARQVEEEAGFWRWLNSRRLRQGEWSAPWPAVFTLGELCLSALLGTWVFAWLTRGRAADLASSPL